MANNGPKFVSVNLNKSYGQQHHSSHNSHFPHYHGSGSSYGQATAFGRGRSVGVGAGGMVVLSRNRSANPKIVPKLSIPPPLNLPSLRKEHEKYDLLGAGGSGAGAGTGGSRPASSGVGWTKPVGVAEKNSSGMDSHVVGAAGTSNVSSANTGSYLPRSSGVGVLASPSRGFPLPGEKLMVLTGEDFPSLQEVRPVSSGTTQKPKDGLNQKQKQIENEDSSLSRTESYHLGPIADAKKSVQSSLTTGESQLMENRGGYASSRNLKIGDYIADPLPLVRMTPRSDWADDERDTGRGFLELDRDVGFPKSESYWDRDFDFPRPGVLPYKSLQGQYERRGQRDIETGNGFSSAVGKIDSYRKDRGEINHDGRELNKWRTAPLSKNGGSSQEKGNYRVDLGGRMGDHGYISKVDKYIPPHYGDISRDGSSIVSRESVFDRRDSGLVGKQHQNYSEESFNRKGSDHMRMDYHLSEQNNRSRGNNFQGNALSRASFGSSGKLAPTADPVKTMGWDKRLSKTERSFAEEKPLLQDIGSSVFDEKDFFSGGVVGVIKRKKDAAKMTDFHDPVRESFEAELERVQKMQELERQKIIEEQERAIEQARREEEERQKRIQEEEERLRKLDEEARESALRAEQNRLESIQRAEEQRIAREAEKKRMQLEEERRLQAAKQMLQELEAKIAKRQADSVKDDFSASITVADDKLKVAVKEKYISRKSDLDSWENSKRVVDNVTSPGSFDSTTHNRSIGITSKPYPDREDSSRMQERGKDITSWRRDAFENVGLFPLPFSDPETGCYSPRHDIHGVTRASTRKELYGGAGYMPHKDGMSESTSDDFGYQRDRGWNRSGNSDSYGKLKSTHPEFYDDIAGKYGDNGWGLGHSRGYGRPPYSDHTYSSAEANDSYFSGRSRYSMKQPRVLPPPTLASTQRTNSAATEGAGSVTFSDGRVHYVHEAAESVGLRAFYDHNQRNVEPSEIFRLQQESITSEDQKLGNESGCDSQSSLIVSSPPASPPHLSPDELDESEDSRLIFSPDDDKRNTLTRNESVVNHHNNGNAATVAISDSLSAVEDEEWTLERDNTLRQQEEYNEDENGNREDDEVHDENIENPNFRLTPEERDSSHLMNNVVLGFDEGVEVEIPNDDSENNLVTAGGLDGIPGSSLGVAEERGFANAYSSEEQNALASDSHKKIDYNTSGKVSQKYALECSGITVLTARQIAPSSPNGAAGIGQARNISSLTPVEVQGELLAKVDSGLFSDPSVPSPVPAIQIGSIRMPIHIQPPVGQLNYTSISQGILSVASQSSAQPCLSYVSLNQNDANSTTYEPGRNTSTSKIATSLVSISSSNQQRFVSTSEENSAGNLSRGQNKILDSDGYDNSVIHSSSSRASRPSEKKLSETGFRAEESGRLDTVSKSNLPSSRSRVSESRLPQAQTVMQYVTADKVFGGGRSLRHLPAGRGKRFTYAVKNSRGSSSANVNDLDILADVNRLQRRPRRIVQRIEYRIRETDERKATSTLACFNGTGFDDKPNSIENSTGTFARSGSKRSSIANRSLKQRTEIAQWSSGNINSHENYFGEKEIQKDSSAKSQTASHSAELNLRRNASEGDVDAPLQSGFVRVFKQSGIEAPSDEDDFIEVRSKRQMLNDRREQREKEIKAKSRTVKPPRKPHGSRQKDSIFRSQKKLPVQLSGYTAFVAPPVIEPPTGKPSFKSETQPIKPPHSSLESIVSNGVLEHEHGLILDSKNKVISLSQNQIDEAMKPVRYNSRVSAVRGLSSSVTDALLPVPSIVAPDKAVSSGDSSINLLLGGEKIRFGAVTSSITLPPTTIVMSHGIGAPGSSRRDVKTHHFPASDKENSIFFDKEKDVNGSCNPSQDCEAEAEAEAAASAVAVAAINGDEIVGNKCGSANDTETFGGANISRISSGVVEDQQFSSQSRVDELSVSLPADLSVETTPISLWPQLASPHYGPHSEYPFYEMNPSSERPIFGLSHNEESTGAQSQSQKSIASSSGPLGNWQQHHSGIDSFYGHHPAGFSGPFIGPPGSIPGVQGTPLVVYNHFTPVGQYGQVGLSFMGAATYIPSGKQGEWKNASSSSGTHSDEGDVSNVNVGIGQRSAPKMASPTQHLAPGSPLLPLPSTLPVFDMSPFQSGTTDMPVQARWGPIPSSSIQSVPVSRSSQAQVEGVTMPSQVNHGQHSIDKKMAANSFTEFLPPTTSDEGPVFAESGRVNPLRAATTPPIQTGAKENENDEQNKTGSMKPQYLNRNSHGQHGTGSGSGYSFQRGGRSSNQGNEWNHRRVGIRGGNQSSGGGDKAFSSVKVKQIYVAKQTSSGMSNL